MSSKKDSKSKENKSEKVKPSDAAKSAETPQKDEAPVIKPEDTTKPKKEEVKDTTLDRKTLFVRSLPSEVTNDEVSDFFSQFAPVKHSVIVIGKDGKSRGFGFVSFTTDDDALTALAQAKKTKFKDTLLRVYVAKRRERKERQEMGSEKYDEEKKEQAVKQKTAKIIIRNLPWSIRKPEELIDIFKKYGAVKEAHIPKKKDGKMCGFGFVTMSKHTSAEKAVNGSKGLKIAGRSVFVALAVDKSNWEQHRKDTGEDVMRFEKSADKKTLKERKEEEKEEKDKQEKDKQENSDNDDDTANSKEEESINFHSNEQKDGQKKSRRNRQEKYSIFIRNLPYDVTKESLGEHFKKLGDIKYALPVVDKATGLARGTAFVAFEQNGPYEECLLNAPTMPKDSVLLPDDVSPFYVFEGRVMNITPAVDRDSAEKLSERHAAARSELLGREPKERDKRHLFLLNEGRIAPESKLAELLSKTDLEIRDKSYQTRIEQLNSNPSLHLSMTRLAIRNIPRAMNDKALKALGRKAVVEFAKEAKAGKRHTLNKEELDRSKKHIEWVNEKLGITEDDKQNRKFKSKHGIVIQAKIINEIKGSGEYGRSRGYGFLEYRDHRTALMGLRWLNAHQVTAEEIVTGLTDEQKKVAKTEKLIKKKRLVVEFAIENATVIRRRFERIIKSRERGERSKEEGGKRRRDDHDGGYRKRQDRHEQFGRNDGRGGRFDRRGGRDDRRGGKFDRRGGKFDRRGGKFDRRGGRFDRRGGRDDRRYGRDDRSHGRDDRRYGRDDRRGGRGGRDDRRYGRRDDRRYGRRDDRSGKFSRDNSHRNDRVSKPEKKHREKDTKGMKKFERKLAFMMKNQVKKADN